MSANTLFDITPVLPDGFSYVPEFITAEEENRLIEIIRQYDLHSMQFHQYVAKRNVLSFGSGWSFTQQQLVQGNPIPPQFDFLLNKITAHLNLEKELIVQFLITEYPVGAVINWHRDAPPFDIIIGISLLTDCIFKLRPHEKHKQTRSATICLDVQRRSFYRMRGDAKSAWQHSTMPASKLRYSLTFRTLKDDI